MDKIKFGFGRKATAMALTFLMVAGVFAGISFTSERATAEEELEYGIEERETPIGRGWGAWLNGQLTEEIEIHVEYPINYTIILPSQRVDIDETVAANIINASCHVELIEQRVLSVRYGGTWVNISIYRCRVTSEGGDTGVLIYTAGDPVNTGIIPIIVYIPPGSIEVPPEGIDHVEPILDLETQIADNFIYIAGIPIHLSGVESWNLYGYIGFDVYYQDGSVQHYQAYVPPTTYYFEKDIIPPDVHVWYDVGKDYRVWLLGQPTNIVFAPGWYGIWVDAGVYGTIDGTGFQTTSIKTTVLIATDATINIEEIREFIQNISTWTTSPTPGEGDIIEIYYGGELMWSL